ncbi:MAG TPA: cupin domain-containing protein [Burkholderiales bacterium]|nr:cupin domain-containing protein [Burkholderiales bacterium]
MSGRSDVQVVRCAEIPWEDRRNVDNWPSRAGMYWDDREHQLCFRLIDYPVGSVEPRHVHAGSHATTVLKGRAIVDGLTLGPLDVVVGPSNEPHGPLNYVDGCKLLSVFHGSYYHSEVQQLSQEKQYRLIQSAKIPWEKSATLHCEVKTLLERGVGPLLLQVLRYAPGSQTSTRFHAALLVEGTASVDGTELGVWDFLRVPEKSDARLSFPNGAVLLAASLQ